MSAGLWEGTIESEYFSCEDEYLFLEELDARAVEDEAENARLKSLYGDG